MTYCSEYLRVKLVGQKGNKYRVIHCDKEITASIMWWGLFCFNLILIFLGRGGFEGRGQIQRDGEMHKMGVHDVKFIKN